MSIREQLLVVFVLYLRLRGFIVQLLTVIVGTVVLLSTSVFLYGSFYYWYMPSVLHERPVYFKFRSVTDFGADVTLCEITHVHVH